MLNTGQPPSRVAQAVRDQLDRFTHAARWNLCRESACAVAAHAVLDVSSEQDRAMRGGLILLTCGTDGNAIRFLYLLTIEDTTFNRALAPLRAAMD